MSTVNMNVDSFDFFCVNIARDVGALVDYQNGFASFCGFMGADGTVKPMYIIIISSSPND